ncbi:3-keto-5-aminohexanoate cleavage protein [Variovorax sp. V116]|uniref:3-keto-5-aminohexanoate cleavage protein n=1 Tax=Variovorax sp. V116 TaxID=3065953 RepID=UPI0034E8B4AE
MSTPTILCCAVTGNITTLAQHPGLPCTPEQIANACIDAGRAGAAIVHIHVRHADGRPSMELAHYEEVVQRIRASDVDLVINLTTGPGQRFVPSEHDPKVAAAGTTLMRPEPRVEHVAALRPEICSLDLNTMFSGSSVVINTPANVRKMAALIQEAGTVPELEVFDTGDIHLARDLIAEGTLPEPALFQIVLGVKYGADASPTTLAYLRSLLPEYSRWAAFGIGRQAFPMLAQAFLLGGHVRAGLEDNIYLEKGVLAPDNAALVAKGGRIVRELGGRLASAGEAREILGLRKMKPRD